MIRIFHDPQIHTVQLVMIRVLCNAIHKHLVLLLCILRELFVKHFHRVGTFS